MAPQTSPPQEARYCLCGCETPTSAKKTWQKDELHGKRTKHRNGEGGWVDVSEDQARRFVALPKENGRG